MTYNGSHLIIEEQVVGPFNILWAKFRVDYSEILNESYEQDLELDFPEWADLIIEHEGKQTKVKVRDLDYFLNPEAIKAAIKESLK